MAGINALVRRIERLGSAELKARVTARTRDVVLAECVRGFSEERDPYGAAWAPRKRPPAWAIRAFGLMQNDNHRLLDKTGAGLDSLTARALIGRVVVSIKSYFRFHQSGTVRMVARKIFPDAARGLGTWAEPVYRAAVDAVRELMK